MLQSEKYNYISKTCGNLTKLIHEVFNPVISKKLYFSSMIKYLVKLEYII